MSTSRINAGTLDRRIQQMVDALTEKTIHHAIVAIESGNRSYQRVFVSGYAHPDGTPMRPQTPLFTASITKPFIAAAVLKLVERGAVRLTAPMGDYLPRTVTDGLHRLNGIDYTGQITVSHLLCHMSGLPDWLEDRARGKRPLIDRLFAGNDRRFDIEAIAAVVRDELTPHFPPQNLHAAKPLMRYSDTGFQLLMAIIESVTGQTLPDIYREEIIDPLGLLSTWLPERAPGDTPIAPWCQATAITHRVRGRNDAPRIAAGLDAAAADTPGDRPHRFYRNLAVLLSRTRSLPCRLRRSSHCRSALVPVCSASLARDRGAEAVETPVAKTPVLDTAV